MLSNRMNFSYCVVFQNSVTFNIDNHELSNPFNFVLDGLFVYAYDDLHMQNGS